MTAEKQVSVLAVIPARGGSKGLPRKNVLPLAGKPLIAHTLSAAQGAKLLDRTVISTDDDEIAEVCREYGGETPFKRPQELAKDDTLIYPVLTHAVKWLQEHEGYVPDYVMLLQPTSPLRTSQDIDDAISKALDKDADGIVGLCHADSHPYMVMRLDDDGAISQFMKLDAPLAERYSRRQDLPDAYCINGAIYLARRQFLISKETFYSDRTFAHIMPPERSVDIDSELDLRLAELILNRANQS